MRVLLVTQGYPPDPAVGALRPSRVARALAARGHHVDVLCVSNHAGALHTDGRVSVRRLRAWPGPIQLLQRLKSALNLPGGPEASRALPSSLGLSGPATSIRASLRRFLLSICALPDENQGVVPVAVWSGLRRHRQQPYDLIYTSAPCYSLHLAGWLLKGLLRRPWVAEYRDPWRDNAAPRLARGSAPARLVDDWLERGCLRASDLVVAVTEHAGVEFRRRLSRMAGPSKVLVALNGIEALAKPPVARKVSLPLRLLYCGSLYPPRDPEPLLEALGWCHRQGHLPPFELTLVGDCMTYDGQSVQELANRHGVGERVRLRRWLPHADALEMMRSADLLLFLAQRHATQIPNKLFDYLGTCVPILALVDHGSEVAAMLEVAGGHYVAFTGDGPGLREAAQSGLLGALTGATASQSAAVETWSVDCQMAVLVDALEAQFSPLRPWP